MKKILTSFGMIVAIGAVVAGATIAFYNDTETSSGNIFVAGSIDLKVDHLAQTYNGVDCRTCDVDLVSNTSNMVVATTGGSDPVAFPHPAVLVTPTSVTTSGSNWDANIPGADWIWATDPVLLADVTTDVTYTFEKKFTWNGPFAGASVNFAIASDNSYEVWLNGTKIDEDTSENNHSTADVIAVDLTPYILQGTNTLQFVVKNFGQPNGTVLSNPAGLKYALHIDGDCGVEFENSVPGFQDACMLWSEQDLDGSQTFFNFGDIKPEDEGTNLISLHVTSNDAYICLIPNNLVDDENTIVEPETDAGDGPLIGNLPGTYGELSDEIEFFGWTDDNDGVYESGEVVLIPAGTSLNDIQTQMIQMSLSASSTGYIGLAWCAGTQSGPQTTVDTTALDCDGDGMSNIVQTDSAMADLVAYAVQQRNNEDFSCATVDLDPELVVEDNS